MDLHPLGFPGFAKEQDDFGPTFKLTSKTKPVKVPDINDFNESLFTITPSNGFLESTSSFDDYLDTCISPSPSKEGHKEPTLDNQLPKVHVVKPMTPTPSINTDDPIILKPLTPPIFEDEEIYNETVTTMVPFNGGGRGGTATPRVYDDGMAIVQAGPIKQVNYPGAGNEIVPDMAKIPGYEGISFELTPAVPPSYKIHEQVEINHMPTRRTETNLPEIKEYQIRESLVKFAKQNTCFGSTPAKEMVILSINSDSIFHYSLETFCEKRETSWHFEPYRTNVPVSVGHAPGPWEIPVNAPKSFNDGEKIMEVPNTSVVRQCHNCGGMGRKMCNVCHGRKKENCNKCYGSGLKVQKGNHLEKICTNCTGTGKKECKKCSGKGHRPCKICLETGNLRFFVRLIVQWKTHIDDKITEATMIPIEKVRQVTGEVAFEEVGPKVEAIKYFPDEAVNVASQTLVNEHHSGFPLERIIEQRQKVRIIPLAECNFSWKTRQGKFYVYGHENKVLFPDYPQKYCWGCTIA